MKQVSMEKFVEEGLRCEVFPITIIKFLLNKRRILSYFSKAAEKDFEIRGPKFTVDYSNCQVCKLKESQGMLCRQHTSIHRVLNATDVAYDHDTSIFFFKNEIFKKVGDKLVIIYCPHPKLITPPISDSKVRKISALTVEDPNLIIKKYEKENIKSFSSGILLDQYMRCWFNDEFSLITIPEDRNYSNFCLIPNK